MDKKKEGLRRLLQIAGRKRWLLVGAAVLAMVHALLSIVPYLLVYAIIKEMLVPPVHLVAIRAYLLWAVVAVVVSYLLLYLAGIAAHIAAYNILYELRSQMAEKLGRLPLGFVSERNSGALKKIMVDDVERLENFIAHSIPDFVKGLALPLAVLGYLFTVDWRLALASCMPMVMLAIIIPLLFNRRRKDLLAAYHRSMAEMNDAIVEFVRAMPVIKIFGRTADSFKRYSGAVNQFRRMVGEWNRHSSPSFAIFISFISNAILPVLALGIHLYFSQELTLPVYFLFLILGVGYIRPLFALPNLGSQVAVISHGVKQVDEILLQKEVITTGDVRPGEDCSISFEDVTFSYDGRTRVLDRLSFQVSKGTITALVGPSGSGKSTAAQLVARFWDADTGHILLGGQDIRQVRPEILLAGVSFVFQESFLFHESIYENIRMGMDKTAEEIVRAAKAAQCHDFISRLPEGYRSPWGASGIQLSGGEQQRIQLARAILKDAPVLILDEATAFSDPENEVLIQRALSKLLRNKTVIVIAHRLSAITHCDQIVVMDRGRAVGKGLHEELLQECKLYQTLWNAHTRAKEFAI